MVLECNFPEIINALLILEVVHVKGLVLFLLLFVNLLLLSSLNNARDGFDKLVVCLIELDNHVVEFCQLTSNDLVSFLQDRQFALLKGFRELTNLLLEQIIDLTALV